MPLWKNIKQGWQKHNDDNKSNYTYLEHDHWGKLTWHLAPISDPTEISKNKSPAC